MEGVAQVGSEGREGGVGIPARWAGVVGFNHFNGGACEQACAEWPLNAPMHARNPWQPRETGNQSGEASRCGSGICCLLSVWIDWLIGNPAQLRQKQTSNDLGRSISCYGICWSDRSKRA